MKKQKTESLQKYIPEYRKQLQKGAIQQAYRGLMEYIGRLRTHFMKEFPQYGVPGSIYHGFMDITFFAVFPKSIRDRKLKVPIVFRHKALRFEVWLSGANRQVQKEYWELIKGSGWNKYRIVDQGAGVDSIVEHVLVDDPDFNELDVLTQQIEKGTLKFIQDVEKFLSKH